MTVPQETIRKMQTLSEEQMTIVVNLVNQLSQSPVDILDSLRNEGLENPMTDDEVDQFVNSVRKERHASRC